uniref:Succinate dehydrogenase subunit 3 n=1 Tax=Kalanchoe fedtschenkoi TaxID=63787 RepID=A0A7N0V2L6_KALFE
MALHRLGRASSVLRAQLRTINGVSGTVSRNSSVGNTIPESDIGLLRQSPFMKAEMQNGRSMLQLQFGVRYLSTGIPSTNETATPAATSGNIEQTAKVMSLRPLSPHLPIYKPQSSSMLSITHRITSVYLVGVVLAYSVIFLQMGKICLTSFPFYQFCCYVLKATPLTMELAALALAYNIFHSIGKFSGRI